jgi:mannose-6-phosphate isomerase-like protein (cupin superfamily)
MSGPTEPRAILAEVELVRFVRELADSPAHWHGRVSPQNGARVYETVWSDDYVNAWVIAWPRGADTGFHDHDNSAAALVVLEGSVIEERLALAGPPLGHRHRAGASVHLPASAIHRVRHGGGEPALTVHAYSPPLRRQGVYRLGSDGALERDAAPYTEELRAPIDDLHATAQAG